MDAVARYRDAAQRADVESLLACLTPDARLVSPLSGRLVFRGRDDLRVLLTAVYGTLRDLEWTDERGDDTVRYASGHAHLGPLGLGDVTRFDLAEDGRIHVIRPHLRPWLALSMLAGVLGARLARHPGVLARALSRAPTAPPGPTATRQTPDGGGVARRRRPGVAR